MKLRALVSLLLLSALPLASALAQSFPDGRPIRLVVPFPPGGSVDTVGRWISQHLSDAWKNPVVVDNRAGAGGNVGADVVAKAPPDGHTVLITTPGLAAAPSMYSKLPFNPLTDFAPISQLTATYFILVVHPSVPVKSVEELIALAKSQPGKLNYGSSGSGATLHLAMEQFKMATGTNFVHVPYKGEAPAYTALMADEVQVALGPVSGLLPHIKAGRLHALAVSTPDRVSTLADLPTIAESGVANFEFTSWFGLFAPAGTPHEIIAKMAAEAAKIVALPDVRDRLPAMGAEAVGSTPEQFAKRFRADVEQYGKVIRAAGIPRAD